MTVLALDLSLTATGWATSIDEHGVYSPGGVRGVERLVVLEHWLYGLVNPNRPKLAVVEGYAFGARGRAMYSIAEWGGVARFTLYQIGTSLVEIPPAVLKKFATGRGNAPKPDMRMELYKRSGMDIADDNEVDALWLLAAAQEAAGEPLWEMPKANREALGKVEWV